MGYFEKYNIEIDPPKDQWMSRVNVTSWREQLESILRRIESTDSGKALFSNLNKKTQATNPLAWVRIRPYPHDFVNPLICNADSYPLGGTQTGLRHYLSQIRFEPDQYLKGSRCFDKSSMDDPKLNRGKLPNEVLFHEFVHAHRQAMRMRAEEDIRMSLRKYTNVEEFLAVVLTNIHITDTSNGKSSGLRGEHRSGAVLEPELSDSLAFFAASADIFTILWRFADEEWPLFNALANVKAYFNPLRTLKENREWAREASQSAAALARDAAAQKIEEERSVRELILPAFGAQLFPGKPTPQLKDLAKVILSPFAKQALDVIKR